MKRMIRTSNLGMVGAAGIAFVAMSVGLRAQAGTEDYTLSRHTIDSGGVMRSTGGDFELSSTIGQPDAGVLTGDDYELQGGFWFSLVPGDCDETGDVNLIDHLGLVSCYAGPGSPVPPDCECYDNNRNGTIDLEDIAEAMAAYNGF